MAPLIRSATIAEEKRQLRASRAQIVPVATPSPEPVPVVQNAEVCLPAVDNAAREAEEAARQAEMHAAWRREAEAARKKAEQEGYAEGHAKGVAEAHEAHREKIAQFAKLIESAGHAFTADLDGLEDIAVGIAFAAVCKILGRTLSSVEGVRAVVGEVVKQAKESEKLLVRLAPGDFYLLLQQKADQAAERPSANIELIPDERVAMGGCILETSGGSLDGRIETQIDALRAVLLQARRERTGGAPRP